MDYSKDFDLFRKDRGISGVAMHQYQNQLSGIYNGYMNPTIIEERQLNVASMDVFSRLMMDRIIMLGTPIDDTVANIVVGQLLYLNSVDSSKHIDIYCNTPGGGVYAGEAIIDTMEFIKPDVNTMVTGTAASMGFMIAIHGVHRSALKHSRLMLHQPSGGTQGQATEIEIAYKEISKIKKELYEMIADKTGQPYEKILKDGDRDYWMTAIEARDYGAIDQVIGIDK